MPMQPTVLGVDDALDPGAFSGGQHVARAIHVRVVELVGVF